MSVLGNLDEIEHDKSHFSFIDDRELGNIMPVIGHYLVPALRTHYWMII